MKIRLKDVIDLEYLIHVDEEHDSKEDIPALAERDRKIYNQCKSHAHSRKELLFAWLSFRKKLFLKNTTKNVDLPGEGFSRLYNFMVYAMAIFGSLSGIIAAYSFLSYHGARPINVALFMVLFVGFQMALMIAFPLLRVLQKPRLSIIHTMLSGFCFAVLPKILNKMRLTPLKNTLGSVEYAYAFIRRKNRQYNGVLFWSFFIPTSVFGFCFSAGVLGATFFKVLVSDLAFGWQSTLVSASKTVYDMVSVIAIPWSWFMPQEFSHPTLAQIEGSRIILKDGLQVLSTQDLISWWPFICMGLLVYAVLPRLLITFAGILMERRVLGKIDFKHPRFNQLIVRMQSPVLNIDEEKAGQAKAIHRSSDNLGEDLSLKEQEVTTEHSKTALFFSKRVYNDAAVQTTVQYLKNQMFLDVEQLHSIDFEFEGDKKTITKISRNRINQVIILYEVWQPPIRGILNYLASFKKEMHEKTNLLILLTGDAGLEDLSVNRDDINFEIWEKAVLKLGDPGINVKRMVG